MECLGILGNLMSRIFQIAGVALNGVSKKENVEKEDEEIRSIDNVQYQRIFGLLHDVNKELDLFSKYGVDKIFELRILSVDTKYRGRGLAKQLFVRSELLAEESGFKVNIFSYFVFSNCYTKR